MEKLYQQLTGINIEEQKQLWDECGRGHYGKFLVFKKIYQSVPGCGKILVNLQVPTSESVAEIDLLLIHETGIYVFATKHYPGTIYGSSTDEFWTQCSRTSANHACENPVIQNQGHIKAIQEKYPDLPIYSFIVFTSFDCELKIAEAIPEVTICTIHNVIKKIKKQCKAKPAVLDIEQIDVLFNTLKQFSPLTEEYVSTDSESIPFYQYADILKADVNDTIKRNNLKFKKLAALCIVGCVFFASFNLCNCSEFKSQCEQQVLAIKQLHDREMLKAQQELDSFAQKFEHVEEFNNGEVKVAKNLILVSDVVLQKSVDVGNAVNFACNLNWNGTSYGVSIGDNAKIIVILKNGSVKEYDLWNQTHPFTDAFNLGPTSWNKTGGIGIHEFYNVKPSDISYIKLANVTVCKYAGGTVVDVSDDYEIELYSHKKVYK